MEAEYELLINGLEELELPLELAPKLWLFFQLLQTWNKSHNFIKAEGRQLLIRHILDSLAGSSTILQGEAKTIADFGSGVGLPGLVLAIAAPQWRFSLVEAAAKRAGFLANAILDLGVYRHTAVLQTRIEELKSQYDIIVCRAFKNLDQNLLDLMLRPLAPGGKIFFYKAKIKHVQMEIVDLEAKNQDCKFVIKPLRVPFLDAERSLLIVERKLT